MGSSQPSSSPGQLVSLSSWFQRIAHNPLALLIIPAAAYIGVFLAQAAYLKAYGVNYDSVRVTVDILALYGSIFLIVVVTLTVVVFPLAHLVYRASQPPRSMAVDRLPVWLDVLVGMILQGLLIYLALEVFKEVSRATGILEADQASISFVLTALLIILFPIVVFLFFVLDQRERSTVSNAPFKVVLREAVRSYKRSTHIFLNTLVGVGVLMGSILLTASFGATNAKGLRSYKFITDEKVIIAEYGDTILIAELKHKKLSGDFYYVKLDALEHPLGFQVKRAELVPKDN
jgi:hypothetical protein